MAIRKTTASGRTMRKATARSAAPQTPPRVAPASNDSNRLLREAAWSRMFGRTEAKNPFAR